MKDTQIHKTILAGKQTLPILCNAIARDGKLTSTNLDQYVITDTDLPDGVYQIVGSQWLPCKDMSVDDAPAVPPIDESKKAVMHVNVDDIKRLVACISKDITRYVLNGVLLHFEKGMVNAVATDGRRLCVATWWAPGQIEGDFIVGGVGKLQPLALLARNKKLSQVTARLSLDGKSISLSDGEQTVIGRLVEGTFPNYKQVLPSSTEIMFLINGDDLNAALKELKPFTPKDKYDPGVVKLEALADKLRIHAEDKHRGIEASREIDIIHQRERVNDVIVYLNINWFMDSMLCRKSGVLIEMTDHCSPVCIGEYAEKTEIDRDNIIVQMPVRKI